MELSDTSSCMTFVTTAATKTALKNVTMPAPVNGWLRYSGSREFNAGSFDMGKAFVHSSAVALGPGKSSKGCCESAARGETKETASSDGA
eukprot:CAMPEP_0172831794 /NCGR_PEP_ID=MMETSP1075-20121228/23215_1 /TAXON_ID=2916 /ORGANISM="Ceratium fusus, Strain PA161109" /LENGTH=89 /DNA_ID=CAMNT_0013674309 /DNA_START=571 /DNA_END=836 /DNA_ORIENTATION=+